MSVEVFSGQRPVVSMTEAALAYMRDRIDGGQALRFGIDKSGCSGYMYVLDFVEQPQQDDHAVQIADDLTVYVAKRLLPMLHGTRIDYVTEGLNSTIKFDNPNAQGQCGCGESFSV